MSQRSAVVESRVSNGGDRIGDDNLRQRVAGVESRVSDGGDRIGDDIRGIRFSGGIGMEQSSILGEEDAIYRLISGIILTYLNLRQRFAGVESTVTDGDDPIANDSISQQVAVRESPLTDGGDRIGDDNLPQRVVTGLESLVSNVGDRIGCILDSNGFRNRE